MYSRVPNNRGKGGGEVEIIGGEGGVAETFPKITNRGNWNNGGREGG